MPRFLASWYSFEPPIEPMSADRRRELADAYRERRAKWGPNWTTPGDHLEARAIGDAYGPARDISDEELVEMIYAHREEGIRQEEGEPQGRPISCRSCGIRFEDGYREGCSTCSARKRKAESRRRRG